MRSLARAIVSLCLALIGAASAQAADGDICSSTASCRIQPPAAQVLSGVKEPPITVQKLCDAKTSATDCGPIYAAVPTARHVVIKIVTANNAGAACTFDDWALYEMPSATPPTVTSTFGALYAFDDDGTTAIVGASAGGEFKSYGPVGPYLFIDAGTIGTCSDFSIWAWYYAEAPTGGAH